jgi:hypothetical protein
MPGDSWGERSGNGRSEGLPPAGPGRFFPFWTFARVHGQGVWEFGNMRNGNTFGQDRQYGHVGPNTRQAFVSRIRSAPTCR